MNLKNKVMVISVLLFAVFAYGNSNYLLDIQNHKPATTLSENIFANIDSNLSKKVNLNIARRLTSIENEMLKIRSKIPT